MTDRDQKSSAQPASSSDASKSKAAPPAAAPAKHDVDAKDTAESGAARPRGQTEDPDSTL